MARPFKKGLNYFPLDTDFHSDRKIQRLLLKYGSEGIGTFLILLCEIYGTNGYYVFMNEALFLDVGFTLKMEENRVEEIIQYCVMLHLFDCKMANTRQILTSHAIQARYVEVCKRQKTRIDTEFFLEKTLKSVSGKGTVISGSSAEIPEVTGVSSGNSALKGKGNKKENKKEKTKEKKKSDEKINRYPEKEGDAARQAELLRMVTAVTAGNPDA